MRIRFYFLFSIFYFLSAVHRLYAQDWQEFKGEHFIVYYTEDKKFAREVLRSAENYYRKIASQLGYQRYSQFWTWDKRVHIYIYPDKNSFLSVTGQSNWSEGMADYTNKQIISYVWHQGFLEALLPHEITHLIFRDYVGLSEKIPLWLDEGVAQWMEPQKRQAVKWAVRKLNQQNRLLALETMMQLDIRQVNDNELVHVFYVEAISLIEFLVTKYGSENFINFCRQLRDGKTVEDALAFVYPRSIRSLKDLEEKWKNHLQEGSNDNR